MFAPGCSPDGLSHGRCPPMFPLARPAPFGSVTGTHPPPSVFCSIVHLNLWHGKLTEVLTVTWPAGAASACAPQHWACADGTAAKCQYMANMIATKNGRRGTLTHPRSQTEFGNAIAGETLFRWRERGTGFPACDALRHGLERPWHTPGNGVAGTRAFPNGVWERGWWRGCGRGCEQGCERRLDGFFMGGGRVSGAGYRPSGCCRGRWARESAGRCHAPLHSHRCSHQGRCPTHR